MKFLGAALAAFLATNYAMASESPVPPSPAQPYSTEQEASRQKAEWAAARARAREINQSNMSDEEKCQARWDIFWPLQKEGNLDARYSRYEAMLEGWVEIDGRPHDKVSYARDITILFFHSLGSSEMNAKIHRFSAEFYWSSQLHSFPSLGLSARLKQCMLSSASQECTKIAVEEKLIPSFEEYASEIDMFIKNGAQVRCPSEADNHSIRR